MATIKPLQSAVVAELQKLPVLSMAQASVIVGIPESTLKMISKTKRDHFPSFKIGRQWRITTADLNRWLAVRGEKAAMGL